MNRHARVVFLVLAAVGVMLVVPLVQGGIRAIAQQPPAASPAGPAVVRAVHGRPVSALTGAQEGQVRAILARDPRLCDILHGQRHTIADIGIWHTGGPEPRSAPPCASCCPRRSAWRSTGR